MAEIDCERRPRALTVLAGGMLGLLVAMGIGRFAYTLLLPLMQAEAGFGPRLAGWVAGANYFGYFIGSLAATAWPAARGQRAPLLIAFAGSAFSTLAMGLSSAPVVWLLLRFISGVASACVFVFVSTLVLTWLRAAGRGNFAGWMYGGVGSGIALTSALALALPSSTSAGLWLLFGAMSAAVLVIAALMLPTQSQVLPANEPSVVASPLADGNGKRLLLAGYTLEGIGYVVSATFIVTVINGAQGRFEYGAWAWLIAGLAGIPACVLWTRRAADRGLLSRLAAAYWIQAVGIIAVALAPASLAATLLSAASLGGTLTGIVLLTMQLAPRLDPAQPRRMVGQLTIGFSVGQMLGPVLAGYAADYFGSFHFALIGSAILVGISALSTHLIMRQHS